MIKILTSFVFKKCGLYSPERRRRKNVENYWECYQIYRRYHHFILACIHEREQQYKVDFSPYYRHQESHHSNLDGHNSAILTIQKILTVNFVRTTNCGVNNKNILDKRLGKSKFRVI